MNYSLFFDDIVKDEYGTWTQVCQHHSEFNLINSLGKLKDCPSENTICGCIECQNKAEYYLDLGESSSPFLFDKMYQ